MLLAAAALAAAAALCTTHHSSSSGPGCDTVISRMAQAVVNALSCGVDHARAHMAKTQRQHAQAKGERWLN